MGAQTGLGRRGSREGGVGERQPRPLETPAGHRLACRHTPGRSPGVLFCGGYTSDMTGTKATALEALCREAGRQFTRFDYSGNGASGGRFEDGTISGWADDAALVLDRVTDGPQVVVGSSMGGWIMLLLALARPARVRALVGIAAAPDFTEDLLLADASAEQRAELEARGYWIQPSAYGEDPYPVTRALIEDGRRRLVLRGPIAIRCPVHLLHGQRDESVPWQTALTLASRLASEDVVVELIKAGDHRLSRPADIVRLCAVVARLASAG
jgi:pimeloyl-ACP methyl ester carboxylesterase